MSAMKKPAWELVFPLRLTPILPFYLQALYEHTACLLSFSVGWHDFLLQHSPSGEERDLQLLDQGGDEFAAGRRSQAKQRGLLSGQLVREMREAHPRRIAYKLVKFCVEA